MKYGFLLRILRVLVYSKRAVWWVGRKVGKALWRLINYPLRAFLYTKYRFFLILKKIGLTNLQERILKRSFLQGLVLIGLLIIALPHTTVLAKQDSLTAGRKTIAFALSGPDEESDVEEITAESAPAVPTFATWREGSVNSQNFFVGSRSFFRDQDLAAIVAGGSAINRPMILPGATPGATRSQVVDYTVEPGDSLGVIADDFGVSIATILWQNNLNARSIIRPGDVLKIPPVSGIMHTVKKGDTLKKIAARYEAKTEDIIAFNHLKEDGTDLVIGEQLMIPGGTKPEDQTVPRAPKTQTNLSQVARRVAAPPGSTAPVSLSGFVWPSSVHTITQYFGWKHHALDIAGPWQSSNYAAKAGVVEKSQCGWNSGYGCYIIIDHGGGVKTLYGHNSQLLVEPGETVQAGQTIALMGNTGHVRGITGIHLHFEVIVNGVRVNPLGYVR